MRVGRPIAGRTTTTTAARKIRAVSTVLSAPAVRASTTLTTKASRHRAVTSSTAAQVSAIAPIRVLWIPRSVRIRARTGNAVTDSETPTKSGKAGNVTLVDDRRG